MLAAHTWSARLLTRYGPACQAQALGLWVCTHGRLDLVCDWLGTQRLHNLLRTRWPTLVPELRAGRTVALVSATRVLPVHTRREGLLGALLYTGAWPATTGVQALLDELARRLSVALRDPLPAPQPAVLSLPLTEFIRPGGDKDVERRFYAAVLERYGGNVALAGRALGLPRATIYNRLKRLGVAPADAAARRRLPEPLDLEEEALELERRTCRQVLERCRHDLVLSAAVLQLTHDAWRAYLRGLQIEPPAATARGRPRWRAAGRRSV